MKSFDLPSLFEAGMIQEGDWQTIRRIRDELLQDSDWTMLEDSGVDKKAWKEYRQALRDIPSKYKNVLDVKLPEMPKKN